jgi:hypothetical protein
MYFVHFITCESSPQFLGQDDAAGAVGPVGRPDFPVRPRLRVCSTFDTVGHTECWRNITSLAGVALLAADEAERFDVAPGEPHSSTVFSGSFSDAGRRLAKTEQTLARFSLPELGVQ